VALSQAGIATDIIGIERDNQTVQHLALISTMDV